MHKEYVKILVSILSIGLGFVGCLLALLLETTNEPYFICFFFVSLILCLVGVFTYVMANRRLHIIRQLKTRQIPNVARWSYLPSNYPRTREQINENHTVYNSLIALIAILNLLIIVGFAFSYDPIPIIPMLFLMLTVLLISGGCFVCCSLFFKRQLSNQTETIISEQYIYFNNQLYSMHKGLYSLGDVEILNDTQTYLRFTYTTPGTPYGPFTTLYIPVPSSHVPRAYKVQSIYSRWIHS